MVWEAECDQHGMGGTKGTTRQNKERLQMQMCEILKDQIQSSQRKQSPTPLLQLFSQKLNQSPEETEDWCFCVGLDTLVYDKH